jgi:hypothetical protein
MRTSSGFYPGAREQRTTLRIEREIADAIQTRQLTSSGGPTAAMVSAS